MPNLFLDKAGADGVVGKVNGQIEVLREAATAINEQILNELPSYWTGSAHDRAEAIYRDEYKDFLCVKVPDMVDQLKQYMSDCVKTIKDVDDQLAGG